MKPVYQTSFGSTDGNCYAACLASIFECPLDDVPDFGEVATVRGGDLLRDVVNEWLKPRGLVSIGLAIYRDFPNVYMVKVGKNPGGGCNHAVVSFGSETVHDPAPEPINIQPMDENGYEYEIFVPVDPSTCSS